jgi:bifunctional UDP-N-acetylglucosamine pyrophosphorylase/glucosamine-1-phosphate N-acetyltransferase
MVDPARTYVDTTVELATDVTLFPGTILQGECVVGSGCEIGPDSRLVDCTVGDEVTMAYSNAVRSTVGRGCEVGPYAVLHPGATLADGTRTGSFVEVTGGAER